MLSNNILHSSTPNKIDRDKKVAKYEKKLISSKFNNDETVGDLNYHLVKKLIRFFFLLEAKF